MTDVKSFEKIAGFREWLAANANRGMKDIAKRSGGEIAARGKGMLEAMKGNTSGRMAQVAHEALSAQKKKHLMLAGAGAVGATGLAGLTYLKGRENSMKKHAGLFSKATMSEKAIKGTKKQYKNIVKFLQELPEGTKKHLLTKVKVKKGHLYAAGAGVAGAGAGAGFLAGREK